MLMVLYREGQEEVLDKNVPAAARVEPRCDHTRAVIEAGLRSQPFNPSGYLG